MKSFIGKPEDELTTDQLNEVFNLSNQMAENREDFEAYMSHLAKQHFEMAEAYYNGMTDKKQALYNIAEFAENIFIEQQYNMMSDEMRYQEQIGVFGMPMGYLIDDIQQLKPRTKQESCDAICAQIDAYAQPTKSEMLMHNKSFNDMLREAGALPPIIIETVDASADNLIGTPTIK